MLTSFKSVLGILTAIAATSSSKEKQKIIAENSHDLFFRDVVFAALDPYKTYKMAGNIKWEGSVPGAREDDLDLIYKIRGKLDEFAKHSGVSKREKDDLSDLAKMAGPAAVEIVNRILNKDLKCGASVLTFKKASDAFEFLPVHHPMKGIDDYDKFYKAAGTRKNICWSVKLDGCRIHAIISRDSDSVIYLSSNGFELDNFHVFDLILNRAATRIVAQRSWDTVIFDGEVINIQGDFSKHMSQFRRLKDMDASGFRFRIFDVFPKYRPYTAPFLERYGLLVNYSGLPVWSGSTDNPYVSDLCTIVGHRTLEENPKKLARTAIDRGFEGIMLKTWNGVYADKRVNYWCKIKAVNTEDLPVVGKVEGTGKYCGTLGALIVRRGDIDVEVGSGFTDAERREFWENPPACIEVKYQEALKSGSLRFPIFVRVRDDKSGAEQ